MSDRVKLTLTSFAGMMLPHAIGYLLGVLVLAALLSTALDLAKQMYIRGAGPYKPSLRS